MAIGLGELQGYLEGGRQNSLLIDWLIQEIRVLRIMTAGTATGAWGLQFNLNLSEEILDFSIDSAEGNFGRRVRDELECRYLSVSLDE